MGRFGQDRRQKLRIPLGLQFSLFCRGFCSTFRRRLTKVQKGDPFRYSTSAPERTHGARPPAFPQRPASVPRSRAALSVTPSHYQRAEIALHVGTISGDATAAPSCGDAGSWRPKFIVDLLFQISSLIGRKSARLLGSRSCVDATLTVSTIRMPLYCKNGGSSVGALLCSV
jgi:hypothetical protein